MNRLAFAAAMLAGSGTAWAGGGPWVLGKGDQQVYVGLGAQTFQRLAVDSGSYTDDVIQVDEGVSSFGAQLIASFGLTRRLEIEADIPYSYTFANNPGGVCDLLAMGACKTTQGIGIITVRAKFLAVDEIQGAPLSLSIGLDARFGQLTAEHRQRITSLGEGTFDIEPRVAIGRIGSLPKGYWSLYVDGSFRWRFPLNSDFAGTGIATPGYEITANLENLFTPIETFSIGPTVSLLSRPNGVDFSATDLTDVDRLISLRILALDAGAKILVRNGRNITVAMAVSRTVYAINNPEDVWKFSLGVGFRDIFRRREP